MYTIGVWQVEKVNIHNDIIMSTKHRLDLSRTCVHTLYTDFMRHASRAVGPVRYICDVPGPVYCIAKRKMFWKIFYSRTSSSAVWWRKNPFIVFFSWHHNFLYILIIWIRILLQYPSALLRGSTVSIFSTHHSYNKLP